MIIVLLYFGEKTQTQNFSRLPYVILRNPTFRIIQHFFLNNA